VIKLYSIIIAVLIVALVAIFLFPDFFKQIMAGVVGLLSVFALKSSKTKKKEKDIEDRKQKINKAEEQEDKADSNYNETKLKHDEDIKKAGEKVDKEDIDNPDDAASLLDDILSDDGPK
jgi:flagellar biosynthesis component FlhA